MREKWLEELESYLSKSHMPVEVKERSSWYAFAGSTAKLSQYHMLHTMFLVDLADCLWPTVPSVAVIVGVPGRRGCGRSSV
jgi:hypothetical protein